MGLLDSVLGSAMGAMSGGGQGGAGGGDMLMRVLGGLLNPSGGAGGLAGLVQQLQQQSPQATAGTTHAATQAEQATQHLHQDVGASAAALPATGQVAHDTAQHRIQQTHGDTPDRLLKKLQVVSIARQPKALLHASAGAARLSRHNHSKASASSKIGSSAPRFIAVQPPVVTSAPELKDVIVIVV